MYSFNLVVGKVNELTKLCLSSWTQKFIRCYTFKEVCWGKEIEYDCITWTKRNNMWCIFVFLLFFFLTHDLVLLSFLSVLLLSFCVLFSSVFLSFLSSSVVVFPVVSSYFPLSAFLSLLLLPFRCCFMFFFNTITSSFLLFLFLLRTNVLFVLYFLVIRL